MPPDLSKFINWMHLLILRCRSGKNDFASNVNHLEKMNSDQRLARIEGLVIALSATRYKVVGNTIHHLLVAAPSTFACETDPLNVLLEDNSLAEFCNDALDYAAPIRLIGNTTPKLRVLEIGAGTGGTTAKILEALKTSYGERLYSNYKYTDISSGFMAAAKQRFANFENIDYAVFDIRKDPLEQGFQPGSFDLIIGANIMQATPSLRVTLGHLHSLLSPGG
jgi:SAM-dependent methyltransferase